MPNLVKIGFSLVFAYTLYLTMPLASPLVYESILELLVLVIKEVAFGLALGFVVNLIFLSFQMAGQMVDFQIGFSMVSYYDSLSTTRVSIFGNIYQWLGLILFFVINGHHIMLYSFAQSFDLIPLAGLELASLDLKVVVNIFTKSFLTAFQIAIPIIFVILMTDAVIGLISRTVPQINILMLDRKSTRLNSSHVRISYAVFCLKKKKHIKDNRIESVPADEYLELLTDHQWEERLITKIERWIKQAGFS